MRTITVERGYDPREFTLVPFGGMGPAIAGIIAAELGIARILIPRDPGTFSAYGMLVTDVQQHKTLTHILPLDEATPAQLDAIFSELEQRALQELMEENFPRERLWARRQAGMRYRGQSYEVPVEVRSLMGTQDLSDLIDRFHAAHARRYGHMAQAEAVEIVNFHVTAIASIPKPRLKTADVPKAAVATPHNVRRAHFNATQTCDVPIWRRTDLPPGLRIEGPAIIEEKTSTIVLYPEQSAEVDPYLNIEIELPR
jgi:N-methylhydantoinase A